MHLYILFKKVLGYLGQKLISLDAMSSVSAVSALNLAPGGSTTNIQSILNLENEISDPKMVKHFSMSFASGYCMFRIVPQFWDTLYNFLS